MKHTKNKREIYREMVQKNFITLYDANRTLIYSGDKPL